MQIFIPCHNRSATTLSFIDHLIEHWPSRIPFSLIILDDGSTDGTSYLISSKWPNLRIPLLDGRQFWGGALNAIQNLLLSQCVLPFSSEDDPWVMIANDDIRYPPGCLEYALEMIYDPNFQFDILAPALVVGWGKVSFDVTTGRFLEHFSYGASNLAVTMSTFLRRSTWLQAEPVPKGIPHYLSDYWFTHSLSCKGFRITTIPEFEVIIRSDTTRPSGPVAPGWRARRAYWRCCLDPRSPDYLPAAIAFRRRFSAEPFKCLSLALLQAKVHIYRLLTGYRPGPLASLQE